MIKIEESMQRLSINISGKFKILQTLLIRKVPFAIAFSGGVDSTLLLAAASYANLTNIHAITCSTPLHSKEESIGTARLAKSLGIPHTILECDPLTEPLIVANPPDRCYHCKKFLYTKMKSFAAEKGYPILLDGSNADDLLAYRPGLRALKELGILSPLAEADLKKDEIRSLAKALNLPNWQAPARPCLATRIPYGVALDSVVLANLARGEAAILSLGFSDCRLRLHGDFLRLELPQEELSLIPLLRGNILDILKPLKVPYITLDLSGLKSGSMDQKLDLSN